MRADQVEVELQVSVAQLTLVLTKVNCLVARLQGRMQYCSLDGLTPFLGACRPCIVL